jgi:hypothetical protein
MTVRGAIGRLEAVLATRRGGVAVFGVALAQFGLVSLFLPVQPGRDFGDYLWFYVQSGDWHSVFPMSMLFRTPVAPIVIGAPLDIAGGWGALVMMALLFALSVVAWTRAALFFGQRVALLSAVALLAFPGYTILFHGLSSNAVFAAAFAAFGLALTRALAEASPRRFAVLALTVSIAALTRPEGQLLLVVALIPLAQALPWKQRLLCASAFLTVAVVLLGGWVLNNGLRYDDYTVARRGVAYLPFFRAYTTDHIVSPANGPASRKLAAAVESDLLTQQPYRAYGVTSEAFFAHGKDREFADLLSLSDSRFGWNDNYSVLFQAGLEAVRAHPGTYVGGVVHTVVFELSHPLFVSLAVAGRPPSAPPRATSGLPTPSEGDLVPTSHQGAYLATPDNHIREVWTSPTDHHLEFTKPEQEAQYDAVQAAATRLAGRVSTYHGSATLTRQLSRSSKLFPPALLWLLAGLVGILVRRPTRALAGVALALSALLVLLFEALSDYPIVEFAVPLVPAFVVFGAVGVVGTSTVRGPSRRWLRWGFSRLEELAGTWRGAIALFAAGIGVYAAEAIAWPLAKGRDFDEYMLSYIQLLDRHPLLPWAPLFRTPLTGVVVGPALDIHGGVLAEPLAAVLYAGSIVLWSAAALAFGRRVALVTAIALLAFPGYGLIFHELASEPVMATVFAGFALMVTRAAQTPSVRAFALVGFAVALLALTRPGNAVLLVAVLFPLVQRSAWRERLRWTAAFTAAALVPLLAWSLQNGWRYGDYTLARGGNALVPFYQVFLRDKIVSPANGAASRRLGEAVQSHLLTRDPYRSYGITLDSFFARPSFREHEDLYTLSDETWGWDSAYSTLRQAALEAIRKHPGAYASGAAHTIWTQLSAPVYRSVAAAPSGAAGPPATVIVNGRQLPAPSEGESIPAGQSSWISRPDNSIRDVWTGPTQHHFVFAVRSQRQQFARIVEKETRLEHALPTRAGNRSLATRLNQLSHRYPPAVLWLIIGVVALVWRRPRGAHALIVVVSAALAVVVFNGLGLLPDRHFMLPVAPGFVLLAIGALLGERRESPPDSS